MTQETISLIQAIANIAIVFTFGVAAWQLWESNREIKKTSIRKRSEYIIQLYNSFVNDKDMIDIYYKLEYNKFFYNSDFHGSPDERKLDKLLGHFANIGKFYYAKILNREDLSFFEYEFIMLYTNSEIHKYLAFLDDWCRRKKINDIKFEYFRKIGEYLKKENITNSNTLK